MPETKQKTAFRAGSGDFDSDLSVAHKIETPSIEELLKSVKQALDSASETIAKQGGRCGCF